MNGLNAAQLVVTMVAVAMIATPLLILAFLAGRRSVVTGKNLQLDRLRPDVTLGASSWRAEFDGEDISQVQVIELDLRQIGCRVIADGKTLDGTRHSFEGVLHHRRLCGVLIDEHREGIWLGTITVDLLPGDQQMTGMRAMWSPKSQTLSVRKAVFTRLEQNVLQSTAVS